MLQSDFSVRNIFEKKDFLRRNVKLESSTLEFIRCEKKKWWDDEFEEIGLKHLQRDFWMQKVLQKKVFEMEFEARN